MLCPTVRSWGWAKLSVRLRSQIQTMPASRQHRVSDTIKSSRTGTVAKTSISMQDSQLTSSCRRVPCWSGACLLHSRLSLRSIAAHAGPPSSLLSPTALRQRLPSCEQQPLRYAPQPATGAGQAIEAADVQEPAQVWEDAILKVLQCSAMPASARTGQQGVSAGLCGLTSDHQLCLAIQFSRSHQAQHEQMKSPGEPRIRSMRVLGNGSRAVCHSRYSTGCRLQGEARRL